MGFFASWNLGSFFSWGEPHAANSHYSVWLFPAQRCCHPPPSPPHTHTHPARSLTWVLHHVQQLCIIMKLVNTQSSSSNITTHLGWDTKVQYSFIVFCCGRQENVLWLCHLVLSWGDVWMQGKSTFSAIMAVAPERNKSEKKLNYLRPIVCTHMKQTKQYCMTQTKINQRENQSRVSCNKTTGTRHIPILLLLLLNVVYIDIKWFDFQRPVQCVFLLL